jgi:UDP-3-O-[3-hydroxymyristoyl] glucosamine N-acyltransferase
VNPAPPKSEAGGGGGGANSITAADIAAQVGGELLGDGSVIITGVAPLDRATDSDISLLVSTRYLDEYADTCAGLVLVKPTFRDRTTGAPARIVVQKPLEGLLSLLPVLYPEAPQAQGIHPTAVLGRGVSLGNAVSIGPYAVLGAGTRIGDNSVIDAHCFLGDRVVLGDNCHLYPSVSLYSGCELGARVVLHAGVRLGSDGFGFTNGSAGHRKIRHVGRVLVGDDVEIGANSCVNRGSIGNTIIGDGTKIDNLVHIAHNVRIGKRCLILASAAIAGSARIEDDVVLAGQVGVAGHLTIGRGARIAAQAGVIRDVPAGETWSGFPARPHLDQLRGAANVAKLGVMMKKLEALLAERE